MSVELVVLALGIVGMVVLACLALAFYVVRKTKLGRFRLSVTLPKQVGIKIEVDAQDKPDELPGK